LGGKEILWEKRNFGDCKRIFEQAVVEALVTSKVTQIFYPDTAITLFFTSPKPTLMRFNMKSLNENA
jgi:hypothetical protein